MYNCVNNNLNSINLEWDEEKSICIVLCSKGFDKYDNGIEIKNLKIKLQKNNYIFHGYNSKR